MRENSGYSPMDTREQVPKISVLNICEFNGVDSGIPEDERHVEYLDANNTKVLYVEALKRNTADPIFVGIPHAGEYVPKDKFERTEDKKAFTDALDAGTAYVFSPNPEAEYLAVRNRVSRMIADPNRPARQFSQKGMGLGGVTWTTNIHGEPVYKPGEEPAEAEMMENVDAYYKPYYDGAHALIGSLHEKMGYQEILFIDGHSFPADVDVPKIGLIAKEPKPMFVLGCQGNTKASGEVMAMFAQAVEKYAPSQADFPDMFHNISEIVKVAPERGWGGFHNVEYFGHPEGIHAGVDEHASDTDLKIHAIQVEMNYSTYYKDGRYNKAHLDAIRSTMQQAIAEVGAALKKKQE